LRLRAFGLTDVGCQRTVNQDLVMIDEELSVFVVADGMGGHRHGEMAAELVCKTIRYYLQCSRDRSDVSWPFGYNFDLTIDGNRLATAIQLANRHVWRRAEQEPEFAGMGSTVAALLADDGSAVAANVGDSRVYLYRGGALEQLTVDDTWIAEVTRRGGVPAAQLDKHPMRNVLTQAAGSGESLQVHMREIELHPGDLFLLSSDGLHAVVGDEGMQAILAGAEDLDRTASRLIEAARARGGPDNIACVLVACG
jgi:PPM family protein phosphatase